MKQKIIISMMAALMCIALSPVSVLATSSSDTESHWASAEIEKWKTTGIITGYLGKFRPDDPITRGEMVVILDRLMRYYWRNGYCPFSDLQSDKFYYGPIVAAYEAGVIRGDGGMLRPEDPITREEATTMMGRAFGSMESANPSGFADATSISSWAKGFVNAFAEKGFVNGYENKFNPKATITRAETVKILDNSIAYVSNLTLSNVFYPDFKDDEDVLNGIVIINNNGFHLKGKTINGDLIISSGSSGLGETELTSVTVNGNVILQFGGRVIIDGGSYIKQLVYAKKHSYDDHSASVFVMDDDTIIEKIYSKVKTPSLWTGSFEEKFPTEFAPGVRD